MPSGLPTRGDAEVWLRSAAQARAVADDLRYRRRVLASRTLPAQLLHHAGVWQSAAAVRSRETLEAGVVEPLRIAAADLAATIATLDDVADRLVADARAVSAADGES